MTESNDPHPWTRRDNESTPAFEAFRTYLNQGAGSRTVRNVAQELDKSSTVIGRWSSEHGWIERARAYDSYLITAETDGHAEELAKVRNRHMGLAHKLLDRLEENLELLPRGADPTIRWTTAFSAATKAQQVATTMREDRAGDETMKKILRLIEKLGNE